MAKFRKIEQHKTYTKREQYENALTRSRAKNRPKSLSYVAIDIGDGEMANVYFTPIPATVLKLREVGLEPIAAFKIIIEVLAECVVEPSTGEPLFTQEEWEHEDPEFINKVTSAVMGIQFVNESEAGEIPEGELIEVDDITASDLASLASDPNPLDATPGSDSLTISTANSEQEDQTNAGEAAT